MTTDAEKDIFKGLHALFVSSFPKKCASCGAVYQNMEQFLAQTQSLSHHSGLRSNADEAARIIVEVFRNCKCGSTLMDVCSDRRDLSEDGHGRRAQFNQLLTQLINHGIEENLAKQELRQFLTGQRSELIEQLHLEHIRAQNNPPSDKK